MASTSKSGSSSSDPLSKIGCPGDLIPEDLKHISIPPLVHSVLSGLGTHPLDYAKTLMQLGHEPFSPVPTKTFLTRKPALALPSVFQYMGHIRKVDGFTGLYRGLTPRLMELGLNVVIAQKMEDLWPYLTNQPEKNEEEDEDEDSMSDQEKFKKCVDEASKEAAKRITCLILTQPLRVITVRTMAQFIGREEKYNGIFGSIQAVLHENGILGFWSGLIPRAIGELTLVGLSYSAVYVINNYILEEKGMKNYTGLFVNFITSSLCYPFHVVGNCMAVSRSGLIAGYPPKMPMYLSWTDCFRHLKKYGQLNRGSSLLFRYYTGPKVVVGNKVLPLNPNMY